MIKKTNEQTNRNRHSTKIVCVRVRDDLKSKNADDRKTRFIRTVSSNTDKWQKIEDDDNVA